jgi:hypothetical protein
MPVASHWVCLHQVDARVIDLYLCSLIMFNAHLWCIGSHCLHWLMLVQCGLFWYLLYQADACCITLSVSVSCWCHTYADRYVHILTNDVIAHIACTGSCWYAVDFPGLYCIRMMLVASNFVWLYHVDATLMLIDIYLCSLMMSLLTSPVPADVDTLLLFLNCIVSEWCLLHHTECVCIM